MPNQTTPGVIGSSSSTLPPYYYQLTAESLNSMTGVNDYLNKTLERRKTMLENVKGYVEKHKDVIFTLGLVILVDHFLFKGALRERIKGTLEGVLKKAENLIEQKKGE